MDSQQDAPKLVTLDELKKVRDYLYTTKQVVKTPLLKNVEVFSDSVKNKSLSSLNLKLENMQNQGSYKIRGILNIVSSLNRETKLATFSGGNFARSFAYVSKQMGLDSTIVMPEDVSKSRIAICGEYGAKVQLCKRMEISNFAKDYAEKNSLKLIHPFEDLRIIAGCGSIGLEILDELPDVDLVLCSIGGGSLISGIAAAIKLSGSNAKIIGVEPEGAPKMFNSLVEGKPHTLAKIETFASGLSPPYAGEQAFHHVKEFVEKVVLVSDDAIKRAIKTLYLDYKLVVESSGAATFAAILDDKVDFAGKKVLCVLSGGNIGTDEMEKVFKDLENN